MIAHRARKPSAVIASAVLGLAGCRTEHPVSMPAVPAARAAWITATASDRRTVENVRIGDPRIVEALRELVDARRDGWTDALPGDARAADYNVAIRLERRTGRVAAWLLIGKAGAFRSVSDEPWRRSASDTGAPPEGTYFRAAGTDDRVSVCAIVPQLRGSCGALLAAPAHYPSPASVSCPSDGAILSRLRRILDGIRPPVTQPTKEFYVRDPTAGKRGAKVRWARPITIGPYFRGGRDDRPLQNAVIFDEVFLPVHSDLGPSRRGVYVHVFGAGSPAPFWILLASDDAETLC